MESNSPFLWLQSPVGVNDKTCPDQEDTILLVLASIGWDLQETDTKF